jgi:hypothetical protein
MKSKNHSQEELKEADELSRDVLDNLCNDALEDAERTGKGSRTKSKGKGESSGNGGSKKQLVSKVNVSNNHQSDLNAILAKAQKVKLGRGDENFEALGDLEKKHVSQSEKDILNEFRNVGREEGNEEEEGEDAQEEADDEEDEKRGKRRQRGGRGPGEQSSSNRRHDRGRFLVEHRTRPRRGELQDRVL